MFKNIINLDNQIYKKLQNYSKIYFFKITGYVGNIFFVSVFLLVIFFLPLDYFKKISIISFIGLAIDTILVFFIKFIFKRHRIENDDKLFLKKIDPYSFPSGHVSRLSVLIITFYYMPVFLLIIFIITFLVGFSRMVRGYHYLSDCIIGMLIGLFSGFISIITSQFYYDYIIMILKYIKLI